MSTLVPLHLSSDFSVAGALSAGNAPSRIVISAPLLPSYATELRRLFVPVTAGLLVQCWEFSVLHNIIRLLLFTDCGRGARML